MKLRILMERYIGWRRLHGAVFNKEASILDKFLMSLDLEVDCTKITCQDVCLFLAESGTRVHARADRYRTLSGFYRYAVSRGHVTQSPLPLREAEPEVPKSRPPHIYSSEELTRLFGAISDSRKKAVKLDESTFRTLLLLLYGAGLRISEALRLTIADVDLNQAVVTVRRTKFNKSRIVPLGGQLCEAMKLYSEQRIRRTMPNQSDSKFLANLDGTPLRYRTVLAAFRKLLIEAGIQPVGNGFQKPNLHGFRHAFAVHRVITWYREGADVQQLLPALSTCLGHKNLEGTKVYLSMTPELLGEASSRFDNWVNGGSDE